jgi:hypothetical protein
VIDSAKALLAAGAPTKFVSIYNEGIVYLYNGSSWSDFTLGMDAIGGDYYGYSVSLNNDGTICAIGSRGHEINGNVRQGSAYLYSLSGTWSLVNEINFSAGEADDYFGNAVSLNSSGTTVVVGAEQDTRSYWIFNISSYQRPGINNRSRLIQSQRGSTTSGRCIYF